MSSGGRGQASKAAWPMSFFFPFATTTSSAEATGERPGRVIAVCSVKGGVGKTTTSVNLAAALSLEEGVKVLLVDTDPQGHATGCVGDLVSEPGPGLSEVLPDRGADLAAAIVPSDHPGLELLPAGPDLQAAETAVATRIGRETLFRGLLEVPRTHYDYVVIDCPPSLSLLAVMSLVAADAVLVPSEPSALSICGMGDLLTSLGDVRERLNPSLQFLGVLLTRVDGRNKRQNREAVDALTSTVGDHLLDSRIGVSTDLARARIAGRPTVLAAPKSRSAAQYRALVQEVRVRMEEIS